MTLDLQVAVVAFLAMALGEAWRVTVPGVVRDAPLAQATAVALAVSTAWPAGGADRAGPAGLIGPLLLACLATLAVAGVRGHWASLPHDLARTATTVLVAGVLARVSPPGIRSLYEQAGRLDPHAPFTALLLLGVAILAVGAPVVGRAVVHASVERRSLAAELGAHLVRHGPLILATASTAAVMALSLHVLGSASFLLFLVPMALLQPAVTRQRRIREAQRQTLFALSRLTDQAGLTTPGHATRVARLAVPVAREAGVEDADLADVEAAALLHDVGQVGLSRPIPGGATVEISLRDQRRVAATGAAILARTAELSRLAPIVADVGVPHHWAVERGDVATTSRVVRVVSAYDDLAGTGTRLGGAHNPVSAMERILRATPYEYDPDVVDGLIRHLVRTGALTGSDLARLRRLQPGARSGAPDRAS
ncbi:HD-GYP domain-containing protein [Ornithinimicrobium pekingense]|uniref:Lipoprotein n=1 Tax=Ornithinimicrobium pekingense TaxID=384677 RepID=A0ABQ2F7C9_9MICO|nr:HD domain-containing protein [Ornithinimicrobium pekingense]GGK65333.1 lipoprotein [Ornithinimicrobium pekingense]